MKQQITYNYLAKKSNILIQAPQSLLQSRAAGILHYCIAHINRKTSALEPTTLPIQQLIDDLGLSKSAFMRDGEQIMQELRHAYIICTKPRQTAYAIHWFENCALDTAAGNFTYCFTALLAPMLLQLETAFTQVNLNTLLMFDNKYAYRIYELLKVAYYKAQHAHNTIAYDLATLQDQLQLTGCYRGRNGYDKVLTKILRPAIDEINAKAEYHITICANKKTGRKVTALTLQILNKPKPLPLEAHPVCVT